MHLLEIEIMSDDSMLSILLLEADVITQEMYRRELSRHFRVLTCESESEALHLLQANDIRAIVLEPAWAGEDGWQFLATVREVTDHHPVPILICSVWDQRRSGLQSGATAYLVKPVLPVTLSETLRHILDKRPF